jgi:hypothetical protein
MGSRVDAVRTSRCSVKQRSVESAVKKRHASVASLGRSHAGYSSVADIGGRTPGGVPSGKGF